MKIYRIPDLLGERMIVQAYCPYCGSMIGQVTVDLEMPERRVVSGGFYMALDGIDGVGKTTQIQLLAEYLEGRGFEVVRVREPYLEEIKRIIHSHDLDPDVEAYLFAADRIMLQKEVIMPALEAGKIVVGDRSPYSSLVWQVVMGVPEEVVLALNRAIRYPDLTVVLDTPVEIALERLMRRGGSVTRYENPELMEKARARFLEVAEKYELPVIDASRPVEEVQKEIRELLNRALESKG